MLSSQRSYFIIILVFISISYSLWCFSKCRYVKEAPKNEIERWTRGYLREGARVKVNIYSFLSKPKKNVYFWIVESNTTAIKSVGVMQKMLGPRLYPMPSAQLIDAEVFKEDNFYVFPYTIQIPKAKTFFEKNSSDQSYWKILKEEEGWDTLLFKFKKITNGSTKRIEKWILDADTHIAEHIMIKIYDDYPKKTVVSVKAQPGGIRGADEIHILSLYAQFISIFMGGIIIWLIFSNVYNRTITQSIEREKTRFKTEEYKRKYLKKNKKEK